MFGKMGEIQLQFIVTCEKETNGLSLNNGDSFAFRHT